jgi:hypothetical protein
MQVTDDKDAPDKLRQAEEWIMTAPVGSEHWKAAWDYIRFLLGCEPDIPSPAPSANLRARCQEIANNGILREEWLRP